MSVTSVIHIVNHPPAYEACIGEKRPDINWDTRYGSWVGIWGTDWSDQLSNEMLILSEEFRHEVWQPDLRANKIYSHQYENGLIHRLFPAKKMLDGVFSEPMNHMLNKYNSNKIIFHIGYPPFQGIYKKAIDICDKSSFVLTFHGQISLPYNFIFKIQKKPVKKIKYVKEHLIASKYFSKLSYVTYQSDTNLKTLKKYYNGKMRKLTMGIDTKIFKNGDKAISRKKLGIKPDVKVLLTVSRVYEHKQIDRLIKVLKRIDNDFLFIVVGRGEEKYISYLKYLAEPLIEARKIRFTGFIERQMLSDYYNASDLFIHVSKGEAGPVSVMEAMSCELPVLITDTGNTAEILKENNAGSIVGIKQYKDWEEEIVKFLKGKQVISLERNVVIEKYDWSFVAKEFLDIYRNINTKI